jgi:hypothetical protein
VARPGSFATFTCGLLAALAATPCAGAGQSIATSLAISGFPITLTSPTGADFLSGQVQSAGVTFEVDATAGPANQARTATVALRCQLPCPTSGSKALAALQWRRADLGTWTSLTTSDVVVEQRSMSHNGLNDPWGNTLFFRFLLDWLSDPAGTSGSFELVVTLTVTAP